MSHSPNNPPELRMLGVLGFAGSIREGSSNHALLQVAMELAPDGTFDDAGQLPDAWTREFMGDYLTTFREFVHELGDAIPAKDGS